MTERQAAAQGSSHEFELDLSVFGMWLFLASEVMFFGALFTGYLIYRQAYPEAFIEASRHLNVALGGINTVILLTSSFTIALAVHSAQLAQRRSVIAFILATILLGVVFLGIKSVEYYQEFQANLFPGGDFSFAGGSADQVRLFFSLYFAMTGVHALHMVLGIMALSILAWMIWRGGVSPRRYTPVELIALYWHFVDIVWIFLFPLLYLINPS